MLDPGESGSSGSRRRRRREALAGRLQHRRLARDAGTKQAQLIEMLEAPEGASTAEIVAAFGWQPHTVRAAIAGALKKKLGLQIGSEAIEGRGRVYRIMP